MTIHKPAISATPTEKGKPVTAPLEIIVRPADRFGRSRVIARRGALSHRDVFDLNDAFRRGLFLDQVRVALLDFTGDGLPTIEEIDRQLQEAAERLAITGDRPVLKRLSDVAEESIDWLWPGRIACGKFTLLSGDPGLGKSFVTLDMAARVTSGRPWPDEPLDSPWRPPGTALLLSAEDDPADTLRPRLAAMEADLDRIVLLDGVQVENEEGLTEHRSFSLVTMLDHLEASISQLSDCRLVVIDPISAYLQGVDSHRNTEVRSMLAPLAALARRHHTAVVAVNHLNKSQGGPAIYRSMGSLAFAAAARTVWAIVKDPEDGDRRYFLPVKNNLGSDNLALAYTLERCDERSAGRVVWESDPVQLHADDLLARQRPQEAAPRQTQRELAGDWLWVELSAGERAVLELLAAGKSAGFSERTLQRAFQQIGGVSRKSSEGHWVWTLPNTEPFAA
jgi:hypothetical protein